MIPSLIEQIVAARQGSNREQCLTEKREARLEIVLKHVKTVGNITANQLAEMTGYSQSCCREYLRQLVDRNKLYTWKASHQHPRMWAITAKKRRRADGQDNP